MRARLLATTLLPISLSCAFWACSSEDSVTPNVVADGGGGSDPDSAAPEAAAADSATPVATGNRGSIFAISDSTTVANAPRYEHRAGAYFVHTNGAATTTTTKDVGPCVVEKANTDEGPAETDLSAGAIHMTGGKKTIDLLPAADKTYAPVSGTVALWTGGETLTVVGDGKDVPAFTMSVVAPSKLTMTAPTLPAPDANLSVTRSAPLSATWTGTSSGSVVLYLDVATSLNAFSATCTFKASDGKGEIPAAAFTDFPAGDGSFNFYVKEVAVASPPDWTLRFTASSALVGPSGAGAAGVATFK